MFDGYNELLCPPGANPHSFLRDGKMFQNLSVSSPYPAPVTMLEPQGDMPRYKTL